MDKDLAGARGGRMTTLIKVHAASSQLAIARYDTPLGYHTSNGECVRMVAAYFASGSIDSFAAGDLLLHE
jgi:hypothetical protein